jgi:hypothetical protein
MNSYSVFNGVVGIDILLDARKTSEPFQSLRVSLV